MKYYKLNQVVYAFEQDGTQDHLITKDMAAMTADEIDRHINPDKYLTASQKYQQYLKTLTPLSRRQFKLVLLENDLTSKVEQVIDSIQDVKEKNRMIIEYTEATEFQRTSDSIKYMCNLLGLTEEQVNQMWEQGLTL